MFIVLPAIFLKGLHWSYKNYYFNAMKVQQGTADEEPGTLTTLAKGGWMSGCPYHAMLRFFGFPVRVTETELPSAETQIQQPNEP